MITAEEFLEKKHNILLESIANGEQSYSFTKDSIEGWLIEFAKLHVKAALENAYDCDTFKGWTNSDDDNEHKKLFVKNIMTREAIK